VTVPPSTGGGGQSPLHALIDTNVMLDLLLNRQQFLSAAESMWDARDRGLLVAYLTSSSITDIYYICRQHAGPVQAKVSIGTCLTGFTIIAVDLVMLNAAYQMSGNDYEDNVQIAAAMAAGCQHIITRDVKGFQHSAIPPLSPQQAGSLFVP